MRGWSNLDLNQRRACCYIVQLQSPTKEKVLILISVPIPYPEVIHIIVLLSLFILIIGLVIIEVVSDGLFKVILSIGM